MKNASVILASTMLFAVSFTGPAKGQDPVLHEYGVFAATQDQVGEIFINGFPYRTSDLSIGTSHSEIITRFLKAGDNEVVIRCTDQFDPDGEKKSGFCRFRLEERTSGVVVKTVFEIDRQCDPDTEEPGRRDEIFTLTTGGDFATENRSKLGERTTTFVVDLAAESTTFSWDQTGRAYNESRVTVSLPDAPLPELPWLSAPVPLDAAGQAKIRQLVADLQQAFEDRDASLVVSTIAAKSNRTAIAMGKTGAEMAAVLTDFYNQRVFSISNLMFAELDPAQITFLSYDGLNLVQPLIGGKPPIQATGDDFNFSMKLFLSHSEGEWRIVE